MKITLELILSIILGIFIGTSISNECKYQINTITI